MKRVWEKLSLREKRLLLLLIFVLAAVAAYNIIWQVQYPRFISLQANLRAEREKLAQAKSIEKNLPELEAARHETEDRLAEIKAKFTGDSRWGLTMIEIGRYLDEMTLMAVSPSEAIPQEHFYEVAVNVKVKGMYSEIRLFVNAIDKMPLVAVRALRLLSDKVANQVPVQLAAIGPPVLAELNLVFYSLMDGQVPSIDKQRILDRFELFAPVDPAPVVRPVEVPRENREDLIQGLPEQRRVQFPVNVELPEEDLYSFPIR